MTTRISPLYELMLISESIRSSKTCGYHMSSIGREEKSKPVDGPFVK